MTDDSGIIKNAGEAPLPDKHFRQYDHPTIFQRDAKEVSNGARSDQV